MNIFSYFSTKTYAVGTHWKRLAEAPLMSTHKYVYMEKLEKYLPSTHSYLNLWCKYGNGTVISLTLKAPSKIHSGRYSKKLFYFSEKASLDIACESSAKQTIHMKCQDLFSLKKKKKNRMLSATNFAWRFKG